MFYLSYWLFVLPVWSLMLYSWYELYMPLAYCRIGCYLLSLWYMVPAMGYWALYALGFFVPLWDFSFLYRLLKMHWYAFCLTIITATFVAYIFVLCTVPVISTCLLHQPSWSVLQGSWFSYFIVRSSQVQFQVGCLRFLSHIQLEGGC